MRRADRIDRYLDNAEEQFHEMMRSYYRLTSYVGKIYDLDPDLSQSSRMEDLDRRVNKYIDRINQMRIPTCGTHDKKKE